MKALSSFLPFVLPYAYGCSDPLAEQAILSACIEFCSRTLLVQNTSAETTVIGQADYDVEEPAQMAVVKVLAVYYNGGRLKARSLEMVSSAVAARGEDVGSVTIAPGTPAEWFARDPAQPVISVYPPPAEAVAGGITIRAAHMPTRAATSVADTLFDDYAEDIANGAIARLLAMPNQPFSSPALAGSYRSQFNAAMQSATSLARVGLGAAASRVQPVPFN